MTGDRFFVYVYKTPDGVPFYVGKGSGKRHLDHIKEARNNNITQKQIYINNILNDGKYPIIEKIIENIDEELAFFVEEEYIAKYGRLDLGTGVLTNRTTGGNGWVVWDLLSEEEKTKRVSAFIHYTKYVRVVDDEYKNKISEGLKFYFKHNPISKETRDILSKKSMGELNNFYGKHHTEEVKEHLRKINTGKTIPKETRDKIRDALVGTRIGEDNSFYGRTHSEETRKIISVNSKKAAEEYKKVNGIHWNTGKKTSEETLEKLREKRTCPYCGLTGRGSAMNRYHFDKCKSKYYE